MWSKRFLVFCLAGFVSSCFVLMLIVCLLACLLVLTCKIPESNLKTDSKDLEQRRDEGLEEKVNIWYKMLPL